AVQVHAERQVVRRGELVEARFEPDRIGAQVDELLARDQAAHDLVDLRMQQRLAAGNRDDRRTALLDRREALFGAEVTAQHLDRVLDLAAAAAGQIAAEERLEHQHERVLLAPGKPLPDHVRSDCYGLLERYRHPSSARSRPTLTNPWPRNQETASANAVVTGLRGAPSSVAAFSV